MGTNTTSYQHPYITVQIYDNSEYTEPEVEDYRRSFNGMQVGFFAGGRDNQLLYMPDKTQYLREFGKPNFKLLGQAAYNADNALATDNCGMYIMNLKPDNATYSNVVIMARFKTEAIADTDTEGSGSSSETTGGDTEESGSSTTTNSKIGYYYQDEEVVYIQASDGKFYGYEESDVTVENIDAVYREADIDAITIGVEEGQLVKIKWTDQANLNEIVAAIKRGETPTFNFDEDSSSEDSGSTIEDGDIEDDTEETTTSYKLVYALYATYIENATTVDALKAAVNSLISSDPDADGFFNMPLFLFYSQGRGVYGDNIHIRLANVTEYMNDVDSIEYIYGNWSEEDKPTAHQYSITVMEPTKDGLTERETATVTLNPDGLNMYDDENPSTYMEDVVNDPETGSKRIYVEIYQETFDAICELYNATVKPTDDVDITPFSFDIFNTLSLDGNVIENIEQDTTGDDYINVYAIDGFTMKNGNDGWDDMSEDEIKAERNRLLIKAYAGDIDPYIKSRFSSPADFNLDAGYDIAVNKQMVALAAARKYDLMTYLDTGTVTTTSGLLNVAANMRGIYAFNVVKDGHCYTYRDLEYTRKLCTFTITHWLAKAIPNHMATQYTIYGVPLARDMAILKAGTDYVRGSFKPVIDPDANDVKNTLYKLRVNTYETLSYNSVQRSTAITSCQSNSDRLLEMNEYIIHKTINTAYNLIASKLYKFGEEADRARYQRDADSILQHRLGSYVRNVSVEFEMTPSDEKRSLLRLKVHITFKTVVQRGELELYIDPRVVDTVTVSTAA